MPRKKPLRSPSPSPSRSDLKTQIAEARNLLLVDISNSFTKLAISDGDSLLARWKVPTQKIIDGHIALQNLRPARWSRVVLSSVVPKAAEALMRILPDAPLQIGPRIQLGVGIDYPKPDSIGQDRLANAAAAAARGKLPTVVIDFGTAVSFDIIDSNNNYVGGVIAPGLAAMTSYLYEKTALLPKINLSEPRVVIGKSTKQAMLAGAIHGYRGLIREIIGEIRRELGAARPPEVIATGGYAGLIAAHLPVIKLVDPDLTLHGLRIIARLNP